MDEIWERAVETALDGENDVASVRTLTLDGAAKCVHGRLPPPLIFEKFSNLQHLSIANIGLSSLEQFPRLRNLQKLVLSDNRIAGGLEFLVEARLEFLRDLDLSNNRISDVNDLKPLAELKLVSLDLYECPVTRVKDYRSRAFELIDSLKYLDKMDAEGNERPESDDEDEDAEGSQRPESDDEYEDAEGNQRPELDDEDEDAEENEMAELDDEDEDDDDEDDAGSGEIEGETWPFRLSNGYLTRNDGVIDVDEDEESDADEEVTETSRGVNGLSGASNSHLSNGFRVEDEGDESEEDDDSVEEIYEEDEGEEEDNVVEVHEIDDSSDEEDGVEDDDEEVDNDEGNFEEPDSNGRLIGVEGEIDGHEQGDDDDNGEIGEEDLDDEEDGDFEDEDEEEDYGTGYLIQPVRQVQVDTNGSHLDLGNEGEDAGKEEGISDEDDRDGSVQELPTSSSRKRNRDEDNDSEEEDEETTKKHK